MRQEVTRAHKGWALDSVTIHNEVLRQTKEEITSPPMVGTAGQMTGAVLEPVLKVHILLKTDRWVAQLSPLALQLGFPWS